MKLPVPVKEFFYTLYDWRWKIALFLSLLVAWGIYLELNKPSTFPIRNVQVMGLYSHIDHKVLQATITPVAQAGFFNIKLNDIQRALLTIPWLSTAEIRKIWPDTVVVVLQEHVPVAYWGKNSLVDEKGVVFTPKKIVDVAADLPRLSGQDENGLLVLDTYQRMNQILAPLKMYVVAIELSDRHAWTVTLNNGIQLMFGRDNLWQRLEHFINAYPQTIGDKADRVKSVDLRYENGLAVKWKK
jgi:cell division protein FtsQ